MIDWITFIALATVIIVAGSRLSFYADVLAIKFRISSSVIGALLVSFITSLPELTTTLGSIVTVHSPDMALGNIFGSNLFNLSIIAFCDIVFIKDGVFRNINRGEARPAAMSLGIIAIAAAGLLTPVGFTIFGLNFGLGSVFVIAGYIYFFRRMHKSGGLEELMEAEDAGDADEKSTSGAVAAFVVCALLIVASGVSLAVIADRIAKAGGMTHSFMGILFLATATSLPELSVGISAVRRRSYDLLLGTVLGSNIFNVLVIAIADLLYLDAPLKIPVNLGWTHLFSAGCAMLATLVVLAGILFKPRKPRLSLIYSISTIAIYIVCLFVIYKAWI